MLLPLFSVIASAQTVTFGGSSNDSRQDYAYKLDVIDVVQHVRLVSFEPWLDFDSAGEPELVTFVVYAETTPDDYVLVWDSGLVSVGVNGGFKSSGTIDLDVAAGSRMAIGFVLDDGNYHYHYDSPLVPLDAGWGSIAGAMYTLEDSTFSVPNVINGGSVESVGYEIRVTVETFDADGDGFDDDVDCDDTEATTYPGAPELCDGLDNDCSGAPDDPVDHLYWYTDADGDGFGDDATEVDLCDGSAPSQDQVAVGGDCDDGDARSWPGAVEHCDGADEDCDGVVDDDPAYVDGWADTDGDGFGDANAPTPWCEREQPADVSLDSTDCDDGDADVWPGNAPEVCDGKDNDCNGLVDEGLPEIVYWTDADGDGAGDPDSTLVWCDIAPSGAVDNGFDCDDGDGERFPGNEEVCDGKDNDCDDLAAGETDFDGDGAIDCADCAADDPTRYPGAPELCDGTDYDCDGYGPLPIECDPAPDEKVAVPGCGCESGSSPTSLAALALLLWYRRRRLALDFNAE